jgi:predicted GNAT family N-acyltransferase
MNGERNFSITLADWETRKNDISGIRTKVFIKEQKIPFDEEFDDEDLTAVHVLACTVENIVAGTARLLNNRKIGRVAVLKDWRGKGIGREMVLYLMDLAKSRGATQIELDAQHHAVSFYEKMGYRVTGGEFLDAGIPHFKMIYDFR